MLKNVENTPFEVFDPQPDFTISPLPIEGTSDAAALKMALWVEKQLQLGTITMMPIMLLGDK